MKVLHLSGACRALGQGLLGRRQSLVQCDHQRVPAQDHGHRLGHVARALVLESTGRLRDLLRHRRLRLGHWLGPRFLWPSFTVGNKKSRRGLTPLDVEPRRLTRQRASRLSRAALHLVIRLGASAYYAHAPGVFVL